MTPATPAVKRWQTDDGGLSLVLPDGWNVSGKNIYLFSGLADATVRLFLPDTYNTAKELQEDVQDFAATHKEISAAHFAQQNCTFDGATGMRVSYTNVAKRTTLAYYFGKSGHLWRIEADLPGENTPIPDVLTRLVNSIRVK